MDPNQLSQIIYTRMCEMIPMIVSDVMRQQGGWQQPHPHHQQPHPHHQQPLQQRPRPSKRAKHAAQAKAQDRFIDLCVETAPVDGAIVVDLTDDLVQAGFVFSRSRFADDYERKFSGVVAERLLARQLAVTGHEVRGNRFVIQVAASSEGDAP